MTRQSLKYVETQCPNCEDILLFARPYYCCVNCDRKYRYEENFYGCRVLRRVRYEYGKQQKQLEDDLNTIYPTDMVERNRELRGKHTPSIIPDAKFLTLFHEYKNKSTQRGRPKVYITN